MPLVIKPSDRTDTTEEAILALIVTEHATAEHVGNIDAQRTLERLAALIGTGEHWNVPGVAVGG